MTPFYVVYTQLSLFALFVSLRAAAGAQGAPNGLALIQKNAKRLQRQGQLSSVATASIEIGSCSDLDPLWSSPSNNLIVRAKIELGRSGYSAEYKECAEKKDSRNLPSP